jgi:hypothetical protein
MSIPNSNELQKTDYNPRWFVWTIVFLVITGISLVSYIVLSDSGTNDVASFGVQKAHTVQK